MQKIRLLLRERGLGAVRVGTVDDYQGQEERIIFISTVRSPLAFILENIKPSLALESPWAPPCGFPSSSSSGGMCMCM